jgi:hypothetical protein
MGPHFTMLIGGILPFGAVFIELFFIMSSVWLQRFYYVFGFLILVLSILFITCARTPTPRRCNPLHPLHPQGAAPSPPPPFTVSGAAAPCTQAAAPRAEAAWPHAPSL